MVSIMAILEFFFSTMLKQLKLKTLSIFAGRGVRNPGFHTRRGNLTPLLAFSVCIVFWAYEGDVVALVHQTQIERAESLRCILGQSTLLSQCPSLPKNLKGYLIIKKKKKESRKKFIWTYETNEPIKGPQKYTCRWSGSQMKCCGGGRGGIMQWTGIPSREGGK